MTTNAKTASSPLLDIPSLNHNKKAAGGEYSSASSSSASPVAATPQDLENMSDEVSYPKSSPSDSAKRPRSMSGFDTPIINNHKIVSNLGPNAQPAPMGNPFENRSNSIHSMGESSLNTSSSFGTDHGSLNDTLPRHSDFTIPISNILELQAAQNGSKNSLPDPPVEIQQPSVVKRSILGDSVAKKYHYNQEHRRSIDRNGRVSPSTTTYGSIPPPVTVVNTPSAMAAMTPLSAESASFQRQGDSTTPQLQSPPTPALHQRSSSRMIPRILPTEQYSDDYDDYYDDIVETKKCNDLCTTADPELRDLLPKNHPSRRQHFRQSTHAQALLVGLAFMVVWLPNNAMAPNLTQMAEYYGMNDAERDLYLGSYCALALGVFCLPVSGAIGFMADFYSRKQLFIGCCSLGALMSAWTGWAPNYWSLFLSRLCSGGIMSGSVPVAFSFMGDLFSKEERNAASSGMTSMMGLGILLGQVYAGEVGPSAGWQHPFFVSACVQLAMAIVVALWVEEPVRGGKDAALKELLKSGKKYDKQLTMQGFIHEMKRNDSNRILIPQGFVTSLPWGIIFVFLNDYLSQEKGFSVEQATFLVMLFGLGSAVGGISGGYIGQMFMRGNRSNLPLYMATSTFTGILPFLILLNSDYPDHNGYKAKILSILGGLIANLPSVNIRPCILNVNPPESRGAALTTANLFVTLGRGIGPSFVTLFGSIFDASRQTAFNVSLSAFWTIAAIQLVFLANTLPKDQDAMEEKLERYAADAIEENKANGGDDIEDQTPLSPLRTENTALLHPKTPDRLDPTRREEENFYQSIISSPPGQYMVIDGKSAKESFEFVKLGIQEFGDELILHNAQCRGCDTISPCESQDDVKDKSNDIADMDGQVLFSQEESISQDEMERRRQMWVRRQRQKQSD